MKTLVTGATGLIGGALVEELVGRGGSVRALVRKTSNTTSLRALGVELAYGDITDRSSLTAALEGCQQLYHVASVFEWWLPDRGQYYRVNVDGTRNVLSAAVEAGVSKVVYTSTAEAIGEVRGEKKTENTPHRGYHPSDYSRSKCLAEQEALRFCRSGLPLVCVNPTAVYGAGNLKESGRHLLDFLRGKMAGQFGSYMNFVYIDDVVDGHLLAMEKGRAGERYILASDEDILMRDWWSLVAEIAGTGKLPRELPPWSVKAAAFALESLSALTKKPPLLSRDSVRLTLYGLRADNTKARTELGMTFTPYREGLKRTIQWYRENCPQFKDPV